jgi:hypothetical protein
MEYHFRVKPFGMFDSKKDLFTFNKQMCSNDAQAVFPYLLTAGEEERSIYL